MDWYRHAETLHAVYLTMLSVRTYHIKKPQVSGEESEERASFLHPNNTRAVQADVCSAKVSERQEEHAHTFLCHSPAPICTAVTHSRCHVQHTHEHVDNLTPGDQQTITKQSNLKILVVEVKLLGVFFHDVL